MTRERGASYRPTLMSLLRGHCRVPPTAVPLCVDGALVFSLATPSDVIPGRFPLLSGLAGMWFWFSVRPHTQASFPRKWESGNLMRLLMFSAVLQMPEQGALDPRSSRG